MSLDSLTASARAGLGRPVTRARTEIVATCLLVVDLPDELAQTVGLDEDHYSLARLIASEGYGSRRDPGATNRGRASAAVAITQTCLCAAARRGKTPTSLLTWHAVPRLLGHYGEQRGRWASTTIDPRPWHIEVGRQVLAGEVPDLAQGATQFLDPSVWLDGGGAQRGRPLRPLGEVLRRWCRTSAWIGPIPSVATRYLALFRPEPSSARRAAALAALEAAF